MFGLSLPFLHHMIQGYRLSSQFKLRRISHQKVFGDALFVGGILELPAPAQNHPFTLIGWN